MTWSNFQTSWDDREPWLQEEQAEKAAAKVGRLKVTYEREMEEVKIRRDTEIAQLNDMLLQKEEKSQEKQSRSKSEVEQLKAAIVKHSVRWVVAGGGEGRGQAVVGIIVCIKSEGVGRLLSFIV